MQAEFADDLASSQPSASTPQVVILGAGLSGLCMAIQLKTAGIHTFTILEKSDGVGGTWKDNSYPGSGCDVPSHLYSFSFEPKADWSRKFSPQAEILEYIESCARKYDLYPHIRFRTELASAHFDEAEGIWRLRTGNGEELSANIFVSGTGQLNRPYIPNIPGGDSFQGVAFHSARWDHGQDLGGKRVAVIGNGASAIQFIPRIAPDAAKLSIFQRSANWIVPRKDRSYTAVEKWLFTHLPLLTRLYRYWIYLRLETNFLAFLQGSWWGKLFAKGAKQHLEQQVADPQLRNLLAPDYPVGCKRILISDDYYPALVRPNVEVVTTAIDRITPDAVVTADGQSHPADVIIYATGFQTTEFLAPMEIRGNGGRRLEEVWRDGAEAYLGVTVAGFPNFFMLYGPNTNLGHNSIIFMIECQVHYALQCIQEMMKRGLDCIEVNADAGRRFNDDLQHEIRRSVWATGCESWYKTDSGKITNNWSSFTLRYWLETQMPNFAHYTLRSHSADSSNTRPTQAAA